MINYSIIIPHKEVPDLLRRCLNSIPRREDIQIIVVDDNSKRPANNGASAAINTEVVYPELVKEYPYVEWVWSKNEKGRKGAGRARNLGLERAKGKWIIFADSDDFFNPCFNEALDKYVDNENDILFFYVNSVDSATLKKAHRGDYINNLLNEIVLKNMWGYLSILHIPVSKFIKRNLIFSNNIAFPEIICSEDVLFSVKLIHYANNKVSIMPDHLYTITERSNSLVKQIQTDKYKLTVRMKACCEAYIFLKHKNIINDKTPWYRNICSEIWNELFRMNKIYAFFVFLMILNDKILREVFVEIFENNHPSVKKYRVWRMLHMS